MNKKAALELSITAIVVLIIAITVLGLGIGFIKKQFGAGTELVQEQLTSIKANLRQEIKTGGELLVFSVPEEVNIGKPVGIIIGVKNTAANPDGDRVCYRVEVKCRQPFTPDGQCSEDGNDVAVGGYDFDNQGYVASDFSRRNWFRSILSQFELKNYEGEVYDAVMQVRGIKPDQYEMEVNVYKNINDKACDDADFSDKQQALYASKSFILNVVG